MKLKLLLYFGVFFLFVLLSFIATLPLIPSGFDHIYGELSDPVAWLWNLDWARYALFHSPLDMFNANKLYPMEYSFATTYQPLPLQVIYTPVYLITENQVFTTNFTYISTFFLSGFFMFLLVYHLTGIAWISFCAGCMFAFSPIRLPFEQLHNQAMFWTPLAVLFLDKYYHSVRFKHLALAAIFTVLQITTALEIGFQLIFCIVIYFTIGRCWSILKRPESIVHHVAALLIVIIICVPFFYPFHVLQSRYGFKRTLGETIQFSADPISSYLEARQENRLYGGMRILDEYSPLPGEEKLFSAVVKLAGKVFGENFLSSKMGLERLPGSDIEEKITLKKFFDIWNREDLTKPLFQGFLTMLLGIIGMRFVRKHAKGRIRRTGTIFIGILIFGFIMSLGPVLIVFGHLTYIPLPYLLFYYLIPGFSAIRGVYRFMYMVSFGLSVLGGLGLYYLEKRRSTSRKKWIRTPAAGYIFAGIVCAVIMAESWSVPITVSRIPVGDEIPSVYKWLAETPVDGAICEIPTVKGSLSKYDSNPRYAANRKMYHDRELMYSYYSTYHYRTMVNGAASFLPTERQEVLHNLYSLPDSLSVQFFKDLRINTFILHTDKFEPEDSTIWTPENIKLMGFKTVFQDGYDIVLQFAD